MDTREEITTHKQFQKYLKERGICSKCGEIRALTVAEVNLDPAIPDHVKELIVPILKAQREMQRQVAGAIILTYLREVQGNTKGVK